MTRSGSGPKAASPAVSAEGTSVVRARTTPGREPQADQGPPSVSPKAAASAEAFRPGLTSSGQLSAEAMHQAHRDWADRQVTVSSCFFCSWTFEGSALEGREKAKAHRERKHPEACIRKPRLRRRITKKSIRSAGEEEQIKVDAAEARRLRHDRDFAKVLAKVAKLDSAAESV